MRTTIFIFDSFNKRIVLASMIILVLIGSCTGDSGMMNSALSNQLNGVPESKWKDLSNKKIFFGHQSVGFNIIDGIHDVMKNEDRIIGLNIIETSDPQKFDSAGLFAHSRVGNNTEPGSKLNEFEQMMDKGIGKKCDIAFVKFCFVDITPQTDVLQIFNMYKDMMNRLKQKYPNVVFIHVTIPLEANVTTWKTTIKRLMGKKDIWEYTKNTKKNEYNEMIRKQYAGKEPIFDLALLESTYPDGKRASFTYNGNTYSSLAPEYTYDNSHLNEIGRERAAEGLLLTLANSLIN